MTDLVFLESNGSGTGATAMSELRRLAFRVVLLCHNPTEYADLSPPNPLSACDELIVVDTFSIDKILASIAGRRPAGVVAFDDYRIVQAAAVAQSLRLPHASVVGLVATRFKHLARRATQGIGRGVDYEVVSVEDEIRESRILPCIVKPVDDSGSVGVRVCKSVEEVRAAIDALAESRVNRRGYRRSDRVLIEEFVDGPEFSAEVLWNSATGRWEIVGFTRKIVGDEPYCVELGHVFPHAFAPEVDERLRSTILAWLEATQLTGTVAHVEFKLCDGQPALLEINPRPAGDFIPELVRMTRGVDLLKAYVSLQLEPQHTIPELKTTESADFAAVWFRTGTSGADAGPPRDSYERTGHVIAAGQTEDDALAAARAAAARAELDPLTSA